MPQLPRWQQYVLLAATLLALSTCCCLRWEGHGPWASLTPLVLPFMLWWPPPCAIHKRLQWWGLMVLLMGLVAKLLVSSLWPA